MNPRPEPNAGKAFVPPDSTPVRHASTKHCSECGARLDVHQAASTGLCASRLCLRRHIARRLRAQAEQRLEALGCAAAEWTETILRRLPGAGPFAAPLVVPANERSLRPLPRRRRRAFERHLREQLAGALVGTRSTAERPAAADAEASQAAVATLRIACAACKGRCCAAGAEHAYVDSSVIERAQRLYPDSGREHLVALYLSHLPERSYAGSCVFHAANGCTLPRELRADICNAFYCSGLRAYRARPAERQAGSRQLVLATAGDRLARARVIDAGGHAHPLRVPPALTRIADPSQERQ